MNENTFLNIVTQATSWEIPDCLLEIGTKWSLQTVKSIITIP